MVAGGVESISCVQNEANRHMIMEAWLKQNKPEVYWNDAADRRDRWPSATSIDKRAQDEYGVRSQQRAAAAAAGKFNDEIVPITVTMGVADKATGQPVDEGSDGRRRRGHPRRHHATKAWRRSSRRSPAA
jgi:acetyl-CoA C-acetyltransferase